MNLYDDYFRYREVDDQFYQGYRLPAYYCQLLPKDSAARILDIGCGLGQTLLALRGEGYRDLTGIDISDAAVTNCRAKGLDVVRVDHITEYQPLQRFDFVIMSHVLEHLDKKDIIPTLSFVRQRLLKEGGTLLVATPNAQSNTGCYWAYEDFTHSTIFTAGSLSFVLKSAGFESVDFVDPLGIAGSSLPGRLVKRLLIRLYRMNLSFWNFMTGSSFHRPSPQIFTFELKAVAR